MKTHFFNTVILLLAITFLQAQQIITVSNDVNFVENPPYSFNNLQTALDYAAAHPGPDYTILVCGTPTPYGGVTITSPVTLYGAGYHPDSQFGYPTSINSIGLYGGSGTTIMGFLVNTIYVGEYTDGINDIKIKRNRITGSITRGGIFGGGAHFNWLVANNIINTISAKGNLFNTLITNNIISNQISGYYAGSSVIIANNIFLEYTGSVFSEVHSAIIQNNIFFGVSPLGAYNSAFAANLCTCQYNIDFGIGIQPYMNTEDPDFENVLGEEPNDIFVDAGNNPPGPYDYAYDYHLDPNSGGIGAGTNGSDVGIYGDFHLFPIGGVSPYITSAPPPVPQITLMNILTPNVAPGGKIKVHIKARAQE
ncbi:MAG: hypothetical protein IH598_13445 [Bacteroidales bacterium]|nr:hypothetical protein [Bacteroidales bacterium]